MCISSELYPYEINYLSKSLFNSTKCNAYAFRKHKPQATHEFSWILSYINQISRNFSRGEGASLKEELKPVEVCASKLQILLLQQCCLFEKCKIDTFSFLYFFSLSFWHVIHSACSMYMLKMKTILYGEKTTTCLYKATKMIMSNINLIMIHCKNLNWF